MTGVKVKICGITNLEDAQAAIEAGADLLGFNFYARSARYISPDTARSIVAAIRSGGRCPTLVGVFVNSPLDEVQSILREVDLDLAQLHGDESDRDGDAVGRARLQGAATAIGGRG